MEAQREQFSQRPPQWEKSLSQCERARDALVQRILEAIAALGMAQSGRSLPTKCPSESARVDRGADGGDPGANRCRPGDRSLPRRFGRLRGDPKTAARALASSPRSPASGTRGSRRSCEPTEDRGPGLCQPELFATGTHFWMPAFEGLALALDTAPIVIFTLPPPRHVGSEPKATNRRVIQKCQWLTLCHGTSWMPAYAS